MTAAESAEDGEGRTDEGAGLLCRCEDAGLGLVGLPGGIVNRARDVGVSASASLDEACRW